MASACLATVALASAAHAGTLVPPLDTLPGVKARAVPAKQGRAVLGTALGKPLDGEGVGAGGVRIFGYDLANTAATRRSVTAFRSAKKRAKPKPAKVGDGGVSVTTRSSATVLWRSGARLGLVVVSGKGKLAQALGYAQFAQARLGQPGPRTAWDRALAKIRPDGTLPKAAALQAFVLAYGALPSVKAPPGPRKPIGDATGVAMWVETYRSSLTPAQRKVVDAKLGTRSGGARAAAPNFGDPKFVKDAGYQAIVDGWRAQFDTKIDPLPPNVEIVVGRSANAPPLADAQPQNDQQDFAPGNYHYCRIRVSPDGDDADEDFRKLFLAHETFHCFQFEYWGDRRWSGRTLWTQEGMADWAALAIDPVDYATGGANLTTYIDSSSTSLFERSYDAVGYFSHVQDARGDFWGLVRGTLEAATNEQAFVASGGAEPITFPTWGSSVFRTNTTGNDAWHMLNPIGDIPNFKSHPPAGLQVITNFGAIGADAYTTAQALVQATGGVDLLHVEMGGTARMLSTLSELPQVKDVWLCVATKCECPKGTEGPLPKSTPWTKSSLLALSGEPGDGSGGTVIAYELKFFCKKKEPPSNGGGGGGGDGASNGDPHLYTFDGLKYDFQAAAEFVLARAGSDFEVQTRQEPYLKSKYVTVNTAAAVRVGSTRLTFTAGTSPPAARINGKPVDTAALPLALPGGNALKRFDDDWAVDWADGSQVLVHPVGSYGLLVSVQPSAARKGKLSGLLGDFDGSPADDLKSADGRTVKAKDSKALYGAFEDTWRIRKTSDSLFDYDSGKGPEDYYDKDIPPKPITVDDLPEAKRKNAEKVCRLLGVTEQPVLNDCILDVALTGKKDFASAAAKLLAIIEGGGEAVTAPWEKLSESPVSFAIFPGSALFGGRPLVAWKEDHNDGTGDVRALSFTTSATDAVSAQAPSVVAPGQRGLGDEVALWTHPSGATAALFSGSPPDSVDFAVSGSLLGGDGAWGAPFKLSENDYNDFDVLGGAGREPLFVQGQVGGFGLFASHGIDPSQTPTTVSNGEPTTTNPTLGRDGAGAVWLAYVAPFGSQGIWLRQLDPATGSPLGPPVKAPLSETASSSRPTRLPLACNPAGAGCRVVYPSADGSGPKRILSWAPGESAPTVVSPAEFPRATSAVYRPDGRLWVTWLQNDGTFRIVLGDARGEGAVAAFGAPVRDLDLSGVVLQPVGDDLVVFANASEFNAPRHLYVTHVAAP